MKKSILLILFALLTVLSAHAYDFEVDGIYYNRNYNSDNVSVTYKNTDDRGYSGSVIIPSTVTYNGKTYHVTSIESSAFEDCTGLTSVTIPNSVTSIKSSAFEDCRGLTSVTIPNSVTSIEYWAFKGCTGLTSVTIPESVTSIDYEAFINCTSITSPLYNSKVFAYMPTNYCGEYAIPSGIQLIAGGAFANCSGLTSVTIPEGVTSIGASTFSGCSGLSLVTIPNSVTSIGKGAFGECTGLTSVTIGEGVTSIGYSAFQDCTGLTSVTIGESVTSIGKEAFSGCDNLLSVTSLSKTPPYCEPSVFSVYGTLYVPRDCKIAYQTAQEWLKFFIEELCTAKVTVNVNDASMGTVVGGGVYGLNEQVMLAAIPNKGYYFEKWDDGNTENPRWLTVTEDITLTAIFTKDGGVTANESPEADNLRVYVQDRTIHLSEDCGTVQVYNMAGQRVYNGHATAIPVRQSGVYVVVTNGQRLKVAVR